MENLGSLAILLALCVAFYATVACVVGRIKRKPFLIVSGERAVYAIWALITAQTELSAATPANTQSKWSTRPSLRTGAAPRKPWIKQASRNATLTNN